MTCYDNNYLAEDLQIYTDILWTKQHGYYAVNLRGKRLTSLLRYLLYFTQLAFCVQLFNPDLESYTA
jgi:hypothetical protein